MNFQKFFKDITGNNPYDYQSRLAGGDIGRSCESLLIDVPTGLGKTAAVVMAWLWNRVHLRNKDWPRRLVYCLPMRTLVEQTKSEVQKWLERLAEEFPHEAYNYLAKNSPVVLMGGEDTAEWDIYPEREAILVGTQDMLLSRALNRGYASARARWPMEFGLLNQDCLWVLDEVQLMDVGLATSAQLQAFRRQDHLAGKELRPSVTWWMSATLRPDWLKSADTQALVAELLQDVLIVPPDDKQGGVWESSKPCTLLEVKDIKAWAAKAWETHRASKSGEYGRITLIIANTVRTAREMHAELRKKVKNEAVDLRLVHSRFRGLERRKWRDDFLDRGLCKTGINRIIVATQVVEAGVDISATTLFTELAPWPSLVQRFGRAARYGGIAEVFVVDRHLTEKAALPYGLSELESSRDAVSLLPDASLAGLATFEADHSDLLPRLFPYEPKHLLLRRELEELVDTTPDLSGADLDISRFIRSGEERDVSVFWRDIEKKPEPTIKAIRDELCAVAIAEASKWITEVVKDRAWIWDYLDGEWRRCRKEDIYPGQTILISKDAGGYDISLGWTGATGDHDFKVETDKVSPTDRSDADAAEESEATSKRGWETISFHGAAVADSVRDVAKCIELPENIAKVLNLSARWHDLGKAHPAFQACINADAAHATGDLAKAPDSAWKPKHQLYRISEQDRRRGFRHELATTLTLFGVIERHAPQHPALLGRHGELLAALGHPMPQASSIEPPTVPEQEILDLDQPLFDLFAYLTCAHHGKVRGAWNSSPADQEYLAQDDRGLPIHGVREGDAIPAVAISALDGSIHTIPQTYLHLEPARMGFSQRTGASWSERITELLNKHGPFALSYLEALLRAADIQASRTSAHPIS